MHRSIDGISLFFRRVAVLMPLQSQHTCVCRVRARTASSPSNIPGFSWESGARVHAVRAVGVQYWSISKRIVVTLFDPCTSQGISVWVARPFGGAFWTIPASSVSFSRKPTVTRTIMCVPAKKIYHFTLSMLPSFDRSCEWRATYVSQYPTPRSVSESPSE